MESDKPMGDLCVTMQSCLAAVKNLNSCGMNLHPALRAVRWQAEKSNTKSLCVPLLLGRRVFHDRLAHRLYNGFFFSPQQFGLCVFLVAQHSESLLWAEQGSGNPEPRACSASLQHRIQGYTLRQKRCNSAQGMQRGDGEVF